MGNSYYVILARICNFSTIRIFFSFFSIFLFSVFSLQLTSERGKSIGLVLVLFVFGMWDRVMGRDTPRFLQPAYEHGGKSGCPLAHQFKEQLAGNREFQQSCGIFFWYFYSVI